MLVMLGIECTIIDIQTQLEGALLQRIAVVTAEEGHQELAFEQRIGRIPFDIEELCVGAAAPPLQYIQPPGIARATDCHVVGYDVEDQPHALAAQGFDEAVQGWLAAQLRVDARRIDHVITVHGAGAGGEQR